MAVTIPVMSTWSDGTVPTAAQLNSNVHDCVDLLANRAPHSFARQLFSTTSCANATWTTLSWDWWDVDTDTSMGSGHPTTWICHTPGWYLLSGAINWHVNTTGSRAMRWLKNGVAVQGYTNASFTQVDVGTYHQRLILLANNDTISLQGWQTSGGTLATDLNYAAFRNETSYMDISWQSKDYRVT
jgi:hypothetical protein